MTAQALQPLIEYMTQRGFCSHILLMFATDTTHPMIACLGAGGRNRFYHKAQIMTYGIHLFSHHFLVTIDTTEDCITLLCTSGSHHMMGFIGVLIIHLDIAAVHAYQVIAASHFSGFGTAGMHIRESALSESAGSARLTDKAALLARNPLHIRRLPAVLMIGICHKVPLGIADFKADRIVFRKKGSLRIRGDHDIPHAHGISKQILRVGNTFRKGPGKNDELFQAVATSKGL